MLSPMFLYSLSSLLNCSMTSRIFTSFDNAIWQKDRTVSIRLRSTKLQMTRRTPFPQVHCERESSRRSRQKLRKQICTQRTQNLFCHSIVLHKKWKMAFIQKVTN
jgi:hypothetical protein